MKSYHLLVKAGFTSLVCLIASCAYQANPEADGSVKNPHPPGSHAHFKSEPSYPKTHSVWKDDALFAETHPENSHIKICLNSQRGFLMNGEQVVIDYPICSGRKSHPTPAGTFYIIEKIVDKRSNRYGRIYGPEGELINSDADSQRALVPEGGKFVGASMR
ncbi:MAG: L,D-transpeptidase, partial [Luteolibacter sp.]